MKPKRCAQLLALLVFLIAFDSARAAMTYYVDATAPGGGDGMAWGSAFSDLQAALAVAAFGDEIRVAQGTYRPTIADGDRKATFTLKNGVALLGGFGGLTAGDPDARDIATYETILSGDLNGDDGPDFTNRDENSYHVVTAIDVDGEQSVFEGLTVRGGYANDPDPLGYYFNRGAGMTIVRSSMTIRQCRFTDNSTRVGNDLPLPSRGGGMYITSDSQTLVEDCVFYANRTADHGAAVFITTSDPIFSRCRFEANQTFGFGGGVSSFIANPQFEDCDFIQNSGGTAGGAVFNWSSAIATFVDCRFTGNESLGNQFGNEGVGGAMATTDTGEAHVLRCEFADNHAIGGGAYDQFQGGTSTFENSEFHNNQAMTVGGAALLDGMLGTTEMSAVNCLFDHNTSLAGLGGGAIYNYAWAILQLTNCTLADNAAPDGGGLGTDTVAPGLASLANCIVSGNTPNPFGTPAGAFDVSYSRVEGGWTGTGNIDADPLFADAAARNYRLGAGSPCIDAADNSAVPAGVVQDLEMEDRFVDDPATVDTGAGTAPIVDMGAYEFQARAYAVGDADCDGDIDADDAAALALALVDYDAYLAAHPACGLRQVDTNSDAILDGKDITSFIELILP